MCNRTDVVLEWMGLATALDGGFVAHFKRLAVELDMAIAASYLEEVDGPGGERWPPRNSVALIDRHGRVVYNYAKVHTCQFSGLEALNTAGRRVYAGALDTRSGNVTVASIICYDREQMETARMAALAGAEVILTPNACGLDNATLDQFAVRAMENAAATAMANYAAPYKNGRSVAFDHLGAPLVEAGGEEGLYLARVDIAALRAHRASAFGRAMYPAARHPELCTFPREASFGGRGALGRMNVPL